MLRESLLNQFTMPLWTRNFLRVSDSLPQGAHVLDLLLDGETLKVRRNRERPSHAFECTRAASARNQSASRAVRLTDLAFSCKAAPPRSKPAGPGARRRPARWSR